MLAVYGMYLLFAPVLGRQLAFTGGWYRAHLIHEFNFFVSMVCGTSLA